MTHPQILIVLALISSPASAGEFGAGPPTDPQRALGIEALKLGYVLNGRSMVGWGALDLSGAALPNRDVKLPPEPVGPPRRGDRLR